LSKKKFTAGLESLFGDAADDTIQEEMLLFSEASEKTKETKKNTSGKDFSADLQSFLTEAFEESFEEQLAEKESPPSSDRQVKKRRRKPLSALDALIRNTVEIKETEPDDKLTRRITVVFEKTKLEKLKSIARVEKTLIREIIDEIVGEFIRKYERKKGKL
jgi:hypothetical protein